MKKEKSRFLKLNWWDAAKGLIVAFITALITALYQSIQTGANIFEWATIQNSLMVALAASLAYILKNWLSNENDEFVKKSAKSSFNKLR